MSEKSATNSGLLGGMTEPLLYTLIGVSLVFVAVGAWLYAALWLTLLVELRPQEAPPAGVTTFFVLGGGLVQHGLQPWQGLVAGVNEVLFWTIALLLIAGTVGALRSLLPQLTVCADLLPSRQRGHSHGESRWASRAENRRLGRIARPERLHPDGIVLGWWGRRVLQSPAEDNALVFGVQRSGKTSTVVVPTLLGWRGAIVATSTKEELVRLTARHRSQLGPVWVFAPLDHDQDWIADLGLRPAVWNPVAETSDASRALELADLFTREGKVGESAHWYHSAASLMAGLMLIANREGGDIRSVVRRLNHLALTEYVGLAKSQGDGTAAELLNAFANTPPREAGSIASTARSSLSLWLDARVARATSADTGAGERLDLEAVLRDGATIYLVAPAEEAERARPLFSALLQSLLAAATRRARQQGGVLHPRLLLALDEVANFARIPRLGGYTSTGPGQGIQLLLCFHDLAQLEDGYGPEQARTVWNNCRARLLLPGQGDLRTLEHFSRGIGDETRFFDVPSYNADGRSGFSTQRLGRPLATPDVLRRMRQPVLLYGSPPPAKLEARRWDEVPTWRELVSGVNRARQGEWRAPGWILSSAAGLVTASRGRDGGQ